MYYDEYNRIDSQPPAPPPQTSPPAANKIIVLSLVVSLIAGAVSGGAVVYYLTMGSASFVQPNATVTIQTVASEPKDPVSFAELSSVELVAAIASPSVVEVSTESKVTNPFWGSYITGGAGSGVILSADGYIVTNQHVIDEANNITIRTSDGSVYAAQLIATDAQTDLAVLKISAQGLTPVVFADSGAVRVGQLAVAIGNPLGTLGGSVTDGIISATDRAIAIDNETMTLLQTSAAINPGNSGGGLFDRNGHLVGVVNAKSAGSDIEGLGFAIPSNTVKQVVSELIEHGYVTGRPVLGARVVAITRRSDLYQYKLTDAGLYVTNVYINSGLERWDRILRVDGTDVGSTADMKHIIDQHQPEETIEVLVVRNNREITLSITFSERQRDQMTVDMV